MTLQNKYANRSKISDKKILQIAKLFSIYLDANHIAKLTGINRNTFTDIEASPPATY